MHYKMINLDIITNENSKEHNDKQPFIPDHPNRILIISGSGSRKTNSLLNLIKGQDDVDKLYLYAKYLIEPKYEYLIKKREYVGIEYCTDPNVFIECLDTMDDVYQNIDDYNPSSKRKNFIVFDGIISDIMSDKIFKP